MNLLDEQIDDSPSAAGPGLDRAAPLSAASASAVGRRIIEERFHAPSRAIAAAAGIPLIDDLLQRAPDPAFVERVPIHFARHHQLIGLADAFSPQGNSGERLSVAAASLVNPAALQTVARFMGRPVAAALAPASDVVEAINAAYQQRTGQARHFINRLDPKDNAGELIEAHAREDLLDVDGRAPVIKLVNLVLFDAVQARASDVHVQPYESTVVVRMRIDGVLYDAFELPKTSQEEMISRIKVMGHMNIAEKRLPQDGRATVQVGDRSVDLRIASLPTTFGERVVIRLLDRGARLYTASELGMEAATLTHFRRLITSEHGIILVTGPTGSGKTTTLYAALREINGKERNILTLEDPVEYRLPGISQTQVNEKKGMTFASGLRNVLRQDPDIIMVGEIRDHDTAVMAIQSALTGHLVFSTLHTNDAPGAVARLLDLGIEPYLLASSVVGVLAQRLVRRVCPACAQPAAPTPEDFDRLRARPGELDHARFLVGAGCDACRRTGYRGRVGIFELLAVDDEVRQRISSRATSAEVRAAAITAGMRTLRDDGVAKIASGQTTPEEVIRVTSREAA